MQHHSIIESQDLSEQSPAFEKGFRLSKKNVGNSGFQHKAVDQGGVTVPFYSLEGRPTIGAQYVS